MMLALTDFASPAYHVDLRKFVMKPDMSYIPPDYRFYIYFNRSGAPRFSQMGGILNVKTGRSDLILGEVALYPLGYVGCVGGPRETSLAEAQGLCDISHFARYRHDYRATLWLRIPQRCPAQSSPLSYDGE